MENKLKVKELIRFCVATHFDKLKYPISKTKLLKFLYKTTNSLLETNTLKKSIPFYWYIHGPYSPPLLELSQELLNEKILKINNQGITATSYRLCQHDEDLQEARQIITSIIGKPTSANSMTAINELYLQHAPYRFYISFMSEFSSKLHNYLYDENTIFKTEELKDILHNTIGDLANNSLFSRFKYAYLDYINIMIKLIKLELSEVSQKDTLQTTDDLFETFAKGVRILHHDVYFDSEVPKWKKEFEESVNQMEQNIDKLYDLAVNLGSNKTMLTFSTLVEQVLHLKSKDQLVMISFLPPRNVAQLNYGKIDAEFFEKLNDDEFQDLLNKFKNSHNAIVRHTTKKEIISTTYRMQAS